MFTIFRLPPEVVGANVMAMISFIDAVNLDSAVCSHKSRRDLLNIFSVTLPIDLRNSNNPTRYNSNPTVWNWFWKRHITVKGIEIETHLFGVEALSRNINLVARPVNINYEMGEPDPDVVSYAKRLSTFPAIIQKIDGIAFVGDVRARGLAALIPRMTHLTSIVDEGAYLTEDDFLQLIRAQSSLLENLCIKFNVTSTLLDAILPMGLTLRSLSFSTDTLQEEHYQLIAQHCPHLTTFHLKRYGNHGRSLSYAGVVTIAKSCRGLQDVAISDLSFSDAYLLLFATHCPELRRIRASDCSNAALDALSRNCPQLVALHAAWSVQCLETVARAVPLLARLMTLRVTDNYSDEDTLSTALAHLRDVESLYTYSETLIGAEEIAVMATRCSQLRVLSLSVRDAPGAGTALAAFMRRNPRLESITLTGDVPMTDVLLEAIAESCPKLRVLACACETYPNKFYQNVVTDRAMTRLAQGCPKLRRLKGCSSFGITDISVLALARHCRYLEEVDLRDAEEVTIGALEQLVERTAVSWDFICTNQYDLDLEIAKRAK